MGCVQSYFRKALMGGSASKQQPPQAEGVDDVPDNSLITESPAHSSGLSPSSTLESEKESSSKDSSSDSSKDSSKESSSLKDSDLKEQVIKEEKEEIELEKDFATFDQNEINETKIENDIPVTAAKEINEEAPSVVAAASGTVVAATLVGAALSTLDNPPESEATKETSVIDEDNKQQSSEDKIVTENKNEEKTVQKVEVEAEKTEDSMGIIKQSDESNDNKIVETTEIVSTADNEEKTTNENILRVEVLEQNEELKEPVQEELVSSSATSQEVSSGIPLSDIDNSVSEVVIQDNRPVSSSRYEPDDVVPEIKTADAEETKTVKIETENNVQSSVEETIQPADDIVSSTTDVSNVKINKQVDEQQSESINEATEEKSAAEGVANAPESAVLSSDEQVTIEQSSEQSISEKSSLIEDIVECDFLSKPVDIKDATIDNVDNIVKEAEHTVDVTATQVVSSPVDSKIAKSTDYDIITVDSASEKSLQKPVTEVMPPVPSDILSDDAENEVIVVKAIIENASNIDENIDLISETNESLKSDTENIRQDMPIINKIESVTKSSIPSAILKDDDTLNVTDIQDDAVSKSAAESLAVSNADVSLQESSTNNIDNVPADTEIYGTKILSASATNDEETHKVSVTEIIEKEIEEKVIETLESEVLPEDVLVLSETALETDKEESTITVPDSLGDLELPSESTAEDVSEKLETFILSSEKTNESIGKEEKSETPVVSPGTTDKIESTNTELSKQEEIIPTKEIFTVKADEDIQSGYVGGIPTINLIESEDITISSSDEEVKTSEGIQNVESEVSKIPEETVSKNVDEDSKVVQDTNVTSESQEIENVNKSQSLQSEFKPESISSEENVLKKDMIQKTEEETIHSEKEKETSIEPKEDIKTETSQRSASELSTVDINDKLQQEEENSKSAHAETDQIKALEIKGEQENVVQVDAAESESSLQQDKPNKESEVLDSAASTIQAAFRGYHTRQLLQKTEDDRDSTDATEQSLQSEPVVDNADLEDQEELNAAAAKIQATFKGYQTRKTLKDQTDELECAIISETLEANKQDVDLDSAATKIQATFKGYQTRKTLNKEDQAEESETQSKDDIPITSSKDIIDEELNAAAAKIQATFKGYQTRKLLTKDEEKEILESSQPLETKNEEQISSSEIEQDTKQNEATAVDKNNLVTAVDEELNSAATKIQATFRGFQTRQTIQSQAADDVAIPQTEATVTNDTPAPVTVKDFQSKVGEIQHTSDKEPDVDLVISEATPLTEDIKVAAEDSKVVTALSKEAENISSSSVDADSSVSSAATKIQAGVRGYLTRKHISNATNDTVASSFATEPSISDSQLSVKETSVSIDEDGVRVTESPETEIQKQRLLDGELEEHINGFEEDKTKVVNNYLESLTNNKTLSEDSSVDYKLVNGNATENHKDVGNGIAESINMEKSSSTQYTESEEDKEVWKTIESELEDAATRIQSNYRGYRERQKLVRKDAIQVPTTSSSSSNGSSTVDSEGTKLSKTNDMRTAGEFHDMVVLPPPDISEISNESAVNSK